MRSPRGMGELIPRPLSPVTRTSCRKAGVTHVLMLIGLRRGRRGHVSSRMTSARPSRDDGGITPFFWRVGHTQAGFSPS